MKPFDPTVHTPEALVAELGEVTKLSTDVYLAGSLGRAAIYDHLIGDPLWEYRRRDQLPTQNFLGGAADIDLLNVNANEDDFAPFSVDTGSFKGKQVSITSEGDTWFLESENRKFRRPLDSRTMEPIESRTVFGIECQTIPIQTHIALLGITGTIRAQDEIARELAVHIIESEKIPLFPPELYSPFIELTELNQKSRFAQMRRVYRNLVPYQVRRKIAPVFQPIKDRHLR